MNLRYLKAALFFFLFLLVIPVFAWEGMPMPELHVEGRYLKDSHGHIVNLHGFAQTYSPWFNERGTKWDNYDVDGCLNYNKGIIDRVLQAGWKMNFIRLHMDPYWSNTPGCTGRYEGEECFDETRFVKYLDEVFVPMAEYAVSKGLYVVMRPPGVCPENIEIGGVYHQYLIKVWSIVSQHPSLKNNPSIMFELANEPIHILGPDGTYGANTQGHFDNLKTYFQDIVDIIRTSAGNILWIPGLGYQSLYSGYAVNPVEGENIGYAVHVYPGWFNSGQGYEPFQRGWDDQVQPVADFAPVIVTEMDWAPEHHDKSWGKDITGTAGGDGFGANFQKIVDECGNVSWLLFTDAHLLAEYGNSEAPADVVDFLTDPEACPLPVFQWYQNYADAYDFSGVTDDYLTLSQLQVEGGDNISLLTNSFKSLNINAIFTDGHTESVGSVANIVVGDPDVVSLIRGRILALKDGQTTINVSYSDTKGTEKNLVLYVSSSTFPLTGGFLNPAIWENGSYDEDTRTLKTGIWGFGGWQYDGADLSDYKYIVARLGGDNTANVSFRVFDTNSYWSTPASYPFGDGGEVVVPLKYATKDDGTPLNPAHIYIVGFWSNGSSPFVIETVFLTNSNAYDSPVTIVKNSNGDPINTLVGFTYREDSGPSFSQSFIVYGDMLSDEISVESPDNFEISLMKNEGYSTSLTLNHEGGVVSNTEIFVRLKAGLTRDPYAGNLVVTSTGASDRVISLSGLVEPPVGINHVTDENAKVVFTEYYSITGQRIVHVENWKGIYIERKLLTNGKVISNKIMNRY